MERSVLRVNAVDLPNVAPITAVGVDQSGTRLVLGLSNGTLEAYSLQTGGEGLISALTARKKLSRKVLWCFKNDLRSAPAL